MGLALMFVSRTTRMMATTSGSNVLYDVELRLRGVTLEDVRSFLRDTQ